MNIMWVDDLYNEEAKNGSSFHGQSVSIRDSSRGPIALLFSTTPTPPSSMEDPYCVTEEDGCINGVRVCGV